MIFDEKVRDWEKGVSNPIPDNKYERFKEALAEHSKKFAKRNVMLFVLARATGYRMGDLVGLTVKEIKDALEAGYFSIQESKQYKQWKTNLIKYPNRKKPEKRDAIIGNRLEKYLREYIKEMKNSDFAFPSNKGGGNEAINQDSFSEILSKVGKEVGLRNISGHSPRKTFATKIYEESGRDLEQVRIALGHQSIEETKRYLGIKEKMIMDSFKIADKDL
jgi:site-specific recombinase XerD